MRWIIVILCGQNVNGSTLCRQCLSFNPSGQPLRQDITTEAPLPVADIHGCIACSCVNLMCTLLGRYATWNTIQLPYMQHTAIFFLLLLLLLLLINRDFMLFVVTLKIIISISNWIARCKRNGAIKRCIAICRVVRLKSTQEPRYSRLPVGGV